MVRHLMTRQYRRQSGRLSLLGCLTTLALIGQGRGGEFQDEPWSVTPTAPVITTAFTPVPSSTYISVSRTVCFGWLAFYQKVLSVVTISHCPMHPSCSNYSIAAINKYGAWRGIILTADRLLHEADERKYTIVLKVGLRECYFDPVENNDFWWSK